jgi:hypothetical protein
VDGASQDDRRASNGFLKARWRGKPAKSPAQQPFGFEGLATIMRG